MSFLDKLLGRHPDPTTGWPPFVPPIPAFDVSKMQFGSLRFGDPLESAVFLGRADRFHWREQDKTDSFELVYACGFQVDFLERKFDYLAFLIGPDPYLPDCPNLQYSTPVVAGLGGEDVVFTQLTDRKMLEDLFGTPAYVDVRDDETILFYTPHGMTLEFEMDGKSGSLKRWNIYETAITGPIFKDWPAMK